MKIYQLKNKILRNKLAIKLMILFIIIYLVLNVIYFAFQFSKVINDSIELVKKEEVAFEKFVGNYMAISTQNLKSLLINFERNDLRKSILWENIVMEEINIYQNLSVFSEVYLVDFKQDIIISDQAIVKYNQINQFEKLAIGLNMIKDFSQLSVSNILENSGSFFVVSIPYSNAKGELYGAAIATISLEKFNKETTGFYNYNNKLKYHVQDEHENTIIDQQVVLDKKLSFFNMIKNKINPSDQGPFKKINSDINLSNWFYKIEPNITLLIENFYKEIIGNIYLSVLIFLGLSTIFWNLLRKYEREIYVFFHQNYLKEINKKFIKNSDGNFYITIIDINNFSNINREYGYSIGNEILTHIIKEHELLKKDNNQQMYYLGGDNFLLVANNQNWKTAKKYFSQVREEFSNIFYVSNQRIIDLEFNFVLYQFDVNTYKDIKKFEEHLMIIEQIIKKQFKERERNFLEFKNFKLIQTIYGKQEQMKDFLKRKIKENAFTPYFQSIIDLKTMEVEKYEVLLRIDDSESKEILSPYPYIKIAEQYDLIKKVDYLLISNTLKELNEKKLEFPLSFNLSSKELVDLKHIKKIIELIDWIGYKKDLITFELTETSKINSFKNIIETLLYLKNMGFKMALDDFGTGHSNFEMIKNLNQYCDYIKIDGLFIKNINTNNSDQFLVTSLVNLAKAYNMKVIAEYVENGVTESFLKRIDVDLVQGFYYSKPKDLNSILESGDNL